MTAETAENKLNVFCALLEFSFSHIDQARLGATW